MRRVFARPARPGVLGVLIVVAAVSAAVSSSQLQAARAASPLPSIRTTGGFVPVVGRAAPGVQGSGDLVYHGGPVMTTNKAYSIFWIPSGQTVSSRYVSTINQFFQDVAHDSGQSSNVYASDTQYSNIQYSSTFGGTYTDTTAFPLNGCTAYGGASVCLSDSQLQAEINRVIQAQGWVKNSSNMFFIFTPKNVDSCDGANGCAFRSYCAYHGVTSGGAIYANMPYAVNTFYPSACDEHQYPNGDDADATLNVTSHEHNEAITDFQLNAWYDALGYENGDKCAWDFGTLSGSSGAEYNQTINGHHYFLQREYSNNGHQCVQTYQIQGGGSTPTVTSFSPTSGPVGTSVDVQGTNFTGATQVTFNGTADTSFVVNSSTDITAHVPTGATTGSIAVTTPSGTGTSSSSFTVTTGGGSPPTVSSFTPTSGSVGTSVSITGTNFTGATSVTFNGTASTFTVNSSTSITATVPSGATSGAIAVTTSNGTGASSTSFTVTTSNPIVNGNFESGTFSGWTTGGNNPTPTISTAQAHSPTHSALLGYTGSTGEPYGDSWIQQQFTVPAAGGTLSFYAWEFTTDSVYYDWQTCQLRTPTGSTLATIFGEASNARSWQQKSVSLNNWKGQNVVIWCNVHEDGYGDQTYMYLDDFTVN